MRNHLRLLAYTKPHWRSLVVLLGTMGTMVAVDLLRPWPMKILVDNVLGDQEATGAIDTSSGSCPARTTPTACSGSRSSARSSSS